MTANTYEEYRAKDTSCAGLEVVRNGTAVAIYWPGGCQDHPDVLSCHDGPNGDIEGRLRVARIMLNRTGFVERMNP